MFFFFFPLQQEEPGPQRADVPDLAEWSIPYSDGHWLRAFTVAGQGTKVASALLLPSILGELQPDPGQHLHLSWGFPAQWSQGCCGLILGLAFQELMLVDFCPWSGGFPTTPLVFS